MRKILFPFSIIWWLIISIRNFFYDKGWLKSFEFDFPIVLVGNISTGGTGKTPHVEFLIRMLQQKFKVATLSRGYKRTLKGYALSTELSLVEDIGDEPKQFKQKFPDVEVAVSENRVNGVYYLLNDEPDVQVIIMDDGFQHRRIKPGLQILLTEYNHLFTDDFILPAGNLREPKSAKKRAQIIIVTKCPESISEADKKNIEKKIKLLPGQHLFFTCLEFENVKPLFPVQQKTELLKNDKAVLITGIADPSLLKNHLAKTCDLIRAVSFRDHHYYSVQDIQRMGRETKTIVSTEKDGMRLMEQEEEILKNGLSIFIVPVAVRFLFGGEKAFMDLVTAYIGTYQATNI